MGTKHTAGPWNVAYTDSNGQLVVKNKHIEVATCWHHCVSSIEEEMHANARLIAVTPELFAIARSVAKLQLHQMPDRQSCNCTGCELVREAQAVVSKVTEE
ncbi:MAG: hypothetical protein ACOY9J_13485 [Pseudomonadota bacterium]